MKKNKVFIVIPAYNEQGYIGKVLKDVITNKYPVIVVDDGSVDKTYESAKRFTKNVVRHNVNLGKGAALKTGCEVAFKMGAKFVVVMDSDGQHKASEIDKFVEALSQGNDVVFGSRNMGFGVPLARFLGNKIISVLTALLYGIYVSDILCGYRGFTKKAFTVIDWKSTGYSVETEMVVSTSKNRLKHCEVPVETVYLDGVKGVTVLDGLFILFDLVKWRLIE